MSNSKTKRRNKLAVIERNVKKFGLLTCEICLAPLDKNLRNGKYRFTLDHIKPKSKGGTLAIKNLQAAHARCNRLKGRDTLYVFVGQSG
jgi:5-methylcytosine-specific restriction endonuclease McrA